MLIVANSTAMYICIDESGDVGKCPPSSSPYFIIAGIITDDKHNLDNVIARVRKRLKQQGKHLPSELKYSNTAPSVQKLLLSSIASRNCQIIARGIDKSKFSYSLITSLDVIYLEILHQCFKDIVSIYPNEREYLIHIDRGMASQHLEYLKADFLSILKTYNPDSVAKLQIECIISETSDAIQAADFVAGTIHRHYRYPDESNDFLDILKDKLLKIAVSNKI